MSIDNLGLVKLETLVVALAIVCASAGALGDRDWGKENRAGGDSGNGWNATLIKAVAALRDAGHDPSCFVPSPTTGPLEREYYPPVRGPAVESVLFRAARDQCPESYDVRVYAGRRELTWVWKPGAFTAWQRDVLQRAYEAFQSRGYVLEPQSEYDFRVEETGKELHVEMWMRPEPDACEAELCELWIISVWLDKATLAAKEEDDPR